MRNLSFQSGRWDFLRAMMPGCAFSSGARRRSADTTNFSSIFPRQGNLLIVGDGDFSFSLSLAKHHRGKLTATSLDSPNELYRLYRRAKTNISRLKKFPRIKVFHNVDATQLQQWEQQWHTRKTYPWDAILWNFPYPTGIGKAGTHASHVCQKLLADFFASALPTLRRDTGRIYITTLLRQQPPSHLVTADSDATPNWSLPEVASDAGLQLLEVHPFDAAQYPGYTPKRSFEDSTFPHQHALTFVFGNEDSNFDGDPVEWPPQQPSTQQVEEVFHDELRHLLSKRGEIYVGVFRDVYMQIFGKASLPYDGIERVGATLKRAAAAGVCTLQERQDGELWVVSTDSEGRISSGGGGGGGDCDKVISNARNTEDAPSTEKPEYDSHYSLSTAKQQPTSEHLFHDEIRILLAQQPEVNVGSFQALYQKEFSKPMLRNENESIGATLKRAEVAGCCRLEMRRGGLWLLKA